MKLIFKVPSILLLLYVIFSSICIAASSDNKLDSSEGITDLEHAQSITKGRLKFFNLNKNFGNVYRGQVLTNSFEFENIGKGPVKINSLHSACGCIVTNFEPGHIYDPGAKGKISVSFDTQNFSGRIKKKITVLTSSKKRSSHAITIKADIKQNVWAEQPVVDFGDEQPQNLMPQILTIKTSTKKNIKIGKVTYDDSMLNVVEVPSKNKYEKNFKISIKNLTTVGFYKDTIYFDTTDDYLKSLPVIVRAGVLGKISFSPEYVEFGAVSGKGSRVKEVTFTAKDSFSVVGSRAELNVNGKREYNVEKFLYIDSHSVSSKKKKIRITLRNDEHLKGNVHGKIYLKTNDKLQREIKVDMYAFFK